MRFNPLAGAASLALSSALLLSGCGGSDGDPLANYLAASDTVQINAGVLEAAAESSGTLRVFKAIPFAAPPVGELRWKAPQPVAAWSGVRRSDAFSPACHQGNRPAGLPGSILYQNPGAQSEDCLYLNVWTGAAPASSEKRPVMLLLHGGGYQLGAGSQANYNGAGLAQATAAGSAYAGNLGAANLAALRAKTPQEIMAGAGSVIAPIVDGVVWPDQLDRLMAAGKIHNVPMLLGWNADEGTPYPPFATTLAGYEAAANARYGALASQFKQVYPAASDADVLAMAYAPMRDSLFAWQPWTLARAHAAQHKAKTFLYFFNRYPPYAAGQKFNEQDQPEKFGAYHSLEQVYFYNNLERSVPARPYTDLDRQIASTASSYLVNFARAGDPNAAGLPTWPQFTGPASQTMAIGDTIAPAAVPFRPALDFFDTFYTQSLGRPLPF